MFQPLNSGQMLTSLIRPHYPIAHKLPNHITDAIELIDTLCNKPGAIPQKVLWGFSRLSKERPGFDFHHLGDDVATAVSLTPINLDKETDLGISREAVLLTGYPLVVDLYTRYPECATLDNLLLVARFSRYVELFYFDREIDREAYHEAMKPLFAKMAKLELMLNEQISDQPTRFEMARLGSNDGKHDIRVIRTSGGTFEC